MKLTLNQTEIKAAIVAAVIARCGAGPWRVDCDFRIPAEITVTYADAETLAAEAEAEAETERMVAEWRAKNAAKEEPVEQLITFSTQEVTA